MCHLSNQEHSCLKCVPSTTRASHMKRQHPPHPNPPAPNSHLASLILTGRIAQCSKVRNFWANPPRLPNILVLVTIVTHWSSESQLTLRQPREKVLRFKSTGPKELTELKSQRPRRNLLNPSSKRSKFSSCGLCGSQKRLNSKRKSLSRCFVVVHGPLALQYDLQDDFCMTCI